MTGEFQYYTFLMHTQHTVKYRARDSFITAKMLKKGFQGTILILFLCKSNIIFCNKGLIKNKIKLTYKS